MKILHSRLSQHSGSTPLQRFTSQRPAGSILSTLWSDFPELSLLLGTGMAGSNLTSEPGGDLGQGGSSIQFPCAWSNPVHYSKSSTTDGSPIPYSCVSTWVTSLMESFDSIQMDPSGLAFWVDSRILRLWKGTLPQMMQGKMRLVLALEGPDRVKSQHTTNLCPQFPLPYWVSKPYSGVGYPVQLEDDDSAPLLHLETTSSIMFHEHCPALIFTPYYVLKGRSMLTILSRHLD